MERGRVHNEGEGVRKSERSEVLRGEAGEISKLMQCESEARVWMR